MMTKRIRAVVVALFASSAFVPIASKVQAQPNGVDIGLAIGMGLLGGVLNQQRALPQGVQPGQYGIRPPQQTVQDPDASLKMVQQALRARGFDPGEPNGRISEKTTIAIADFQRANNFPATGRITRAQIAVLMSPSGRNANAAPNRPLGAQAVPERDADLKTVQQALKARGFDPGAPNGRISEKTTIAIADFQRANSFPPTGRITRAQIAVLLGSGGTVTALAAGAAVPARAAFTGMQDEGRRSLLTPVAEAGPEQAPGPRDRPFSPGEPEWASGTWTGSATCWRRTYNIKLVMPKRSENSVAALTYTWQNNVVPGRGSQAVETGSGSLSMNVLERGLSVADVKDGASDHPFSEIALRAGNDGRPIFRSAPCRGELSLTRDPRTAPKRERVQQAADGSAEAAKPRSVPDAKGEPTTQPRGIFGRWDGQLTCRGNESRRLILQFATIPEIARYGGGWDTSRKLTEADRPGRFGAFVTQLIGSDAGGRSASTVLIGEFSDELNAYRLVQVHSSGGIGDTPLSNIVLRESDNALHGEITGENCAKLTATRPDPLASHERPSVPLPRNGGSFYSTNDIANRCEVLVRWGAPTEAEYTVPSYRSKKVDASTLFLDHAFVPVFGVTFDNPNDTTLFADIEAAIRECAKDPLTRPRIEFLRANATLDWSGKTYAGQRVRETRAALNRLNAARVDASRMTDLVRSLNYLSAMREKFANASFAMLPKQKAEINDAVVDELSRRAERVFELEERARSTLAGMEMIEALHETRQFSGPAARHLSGAAKEKILSRLAPVERKEASGIFEPLIQQARSSPESPDGLSAIDALQPRTLFSRLSPSLLREFEASWNAVRSEKEAKAVESEISKPISASRDLRGLELGAVWINDFRERWGAHQQGKSYKAALETFYADRRMRLREAVPVFAGLLREAPDDARPAIRKRIISLHEDERDPIALEYDLLVAGI